MSIAELLADLREAARHVAHQPSSDQGLLQRIAEESVHAAFPDWSFKKAVNHFVELVHRIDEATALAMQSPDLDAFKAEVERVIGSIERHIEEHGSRPDSTEVHLAEVVYRLRTAMESVADGYSADPNLMRPPGSNR